MICRVAGRPLHGADILVAGEAPYGVPRGAGLSSSSALTVGVSLVVAELNGSAFPPASLAWLCGEAEWYVGTRGGIMDQFIALLGKREHALFLDCRAHGGNLTGHPPVSHGGCTAPSRLQHHRGRYQGASPEYALRVQRARGRRSHRCRAAQARYPQITHLRDLEALPWADVEPLLPETLTRSQLDALGLRLADVIDVNLPDTGEPFRVRARCRHVVSENACRARERGGPAARNAARFGALMNEAHVSVRDDYGASCEELEVLRRLACQVEGVIGARLTGAGWGGSHYCPGARGARSGLCRARGAALSPGDGPRPRYL